MRWLSHLDDLRAVAARGVELAVTAFVQDQWGRVLMLRCPDENAWVLPGGVRDIDESLGQTVIRKVGEQAGIEIRVLGLVGIYGDIDDGNGERVAVCLRASPCGRLGHGHACSEMRWLSRDECDAVVIPAPMRLRIRHGLEARPNPFIDRRARAQLAARRR